MSLLQEALHACAALTRRAEHLEYDEVAQTLEIKKLKRRVKKIEKGNKVRVLKLRRLKRVRTSQGVDTSDDTMMDDGSNQGRIIDEIDKDDAVALIDDKEEDKKDEEAEVDENSQEDEPAEVHEVVDVVTTTKLITEVVTDASETVTTASTIIRRKGVVIRDPEEESTTSSIIPADIKSKDKDIDWDGAIDNVKLKGKEDPAVQRYQAMKRKPQTEAQARKNMMMYLKNVVGFSLDYFKGMSYDDIRPIFEAKFNSNIEFLLKKKDQLEEEESRALQNDDVYTEATPLTRKNFDREDLEALWSLVKERFSTLKPKNFTDDFMLTTLGAMFEKPDAQAQVWKNQRTIHGQAMVKSWKLLESCGVHIITFSTTQLILLVDRRYPFSKFTLDQMLNAVRLQVEKE
nr:hypothetical protein [Tanacetum cinerariifolium]